MLGVERRAIRGPLNLHSITSRNSFRFITNGAQFRNRSHLPTPHCSTSPICLPPDLSSSMKTVQETDVWWPGKPRIRALLDGSKYLAVWNT